VASLRLYDAYFDDGFAAAHAAGAAVTKMQNAIFPAGFRSSRARQRQH
jgi:hypothetical protein